MPVLEILVVLALVLLNGYFAMSELAVVSARPARLQARRRRTRRASGAGARPRAGPHGGWRFEVVELDGRRIDKVLVRPSDARG